VLYAINCSLVLTFGLDVPYIANWLYEHPGEVDLDLKGIWIADPSLSWGLVQQEIPALRFAQVTMTAIRMFTAENEMSHRHIEISFHSTRAFMRSYKTYLTLVDTLTILTNSLPIRRLGNYRYPQVQLSIMSQRPSVFKPAADYIVPYNGRYQCE
jgi:hypothetical protein